MRDTAWGILVLLALVAIALCSMGGNASARTVYYDVQHVIFNGLYSMEEDEFLYLLNVEVGKKTTNEKITRGLKRAHLAGIFNSISVRTDDKLKGILHVDIDEKDLVSGIEISRLEKLKTKEIQKVLGIDPGRKVSADTIEKARAALREVVRFRGFPDAQVEYHVRKKSKPNTIDIRVDVDEGAPIIVNSVFIIGEDDSRVKNMLRVRPGNIYDRWIIEQDLNKIEDYYKGLGYLKPVAGPYSYTDGQLMVGFKSGTRLIVKFMGNYSMPDRVIEQTLPFKAAGLVSDDLINQATSLIRDLYVENGFSSVSIAPILTRERDETVLRYYINEGTSRSIRSVRLLGTALERELLDKVLTIRKGDVYKPGEIQKNVEFIRSFLVALGYRDAAVGDPYIKEDGRSVDVTINVNEGSKFIFSDISVTGNKEISLPEILADININVGNPFNEVDISDSRRNVLALCRGRGFYECTVDVTREFEQDGAKIVFKVNEGNRFYFGRNVITGNVRTRAQFIRRHITYGEGHPLSTERIQQSRHSLMRTGLFSKVDITPIYFHDNVADLNVNVEEGNAGSFEFGFGYGEYELERAFFDLSYRNLMGMNRTGSIRTELSSLWRRFIITYIEPSVFGSKYRSITTLSTEKRTEKNIDTGEVNYKVDKVSFGTSIDRNLTEHVKLTLSYEYSIVETYDVKPDVVLSKEDTGTLAISSLSQSLFFDSRDEPFDPGKGMLAGITLKTAASELSSETDFVKATVRASEYFTFFGNLVLAISIKGGRAEGFRDTVDLPITERFFLGGRNTVRGYKQDTLGPKSSAGNPIGGNTFALGNIEVRFRFGHGWRIVPFYDTGYVWIEGDTPSENDLKSTIGIGLQYNTPVGPIRLDYGNKLDREPGESSGKIHFSIGHAF